MTSQAIDPRRRPFRVSVALLAASLALSFGVTAGVAAAGTESAQPPGAPTQVRATAGDGQATVSFTAPADAGSSAITSYTVVARDTFGNEQDATGKASPITVSGLRNGELWNLYVVANNRAGRGPAGFAENPVFPSAYQQLAPDPPTAVRAERGVTQATVSYDAPVRGVDNFVVWGYIASAINVTSPGDGGQSQQIGFNSNSFGAIPTPPLPITIGGLTNGDQYVFSVITVSAPTQSFDGPLDVVLASTASELSNPVTPGGPPGAPTIGKATAATESAIVAFSPPGSDGGLPITAYTVTAEDLSDPSLRGEASGEASPITVPGLIDGHTYTFTVTATNDAGVSPASDPTSPLTLPDGPGRPPGAPTNVVATAGNARAKVSFTAPDAEGSSPIDSYVVVASDTFGNQVEASGKKSPITVEGLSNGELWTLTVAANNEAGQGPVSPAGNAVFPTPSAKYDPDPPTKVTAVPGDSQAVVSYEAPVRRVDDFEILAYVATAIDLTNPANGGQFSLTNDPTAAPITITGLTNGDQYVFSVITVNESGPSFNGPETISASAPSEPSSVVIPAGPPGAPTIGNVTAGDREATVAFTAPGSNGGQPIIDYTVIAHDETDPQHADEQVSGADSPIVVGSLTNGHTYTFTVVARNGAGVSGPSATSEPVVPNGAPVSDPGAPTDVKADAGDGQATVTFDPPAQTGGAPILGYTVTATDLTNPANGGQSIATSTTSATIKGLTNGDRYVFRVTATNDVGTGPPSAPSDPVVPKGSKGDDEPKEPEPDSTTSSRAESRRLPSVVLGRRP